MVMHCRIRTSVGAEVDSRGAKIFHITTTTIVGHGLLRTGPIKSKAGTKMGSYNIFYCLKECGDEEGLVREMMGWDAMGWDGELELGSFQEPKLGIV